MYILLILLAGVVIRLISLNQSLWLDEATSALVARMSIGDMFTKFLPSDFHPPLYYLLLRYWSMIFGSSEVVLRIPSLIFGVGTIYLTYLIGKKLFSKNVGLTASLLLATSGLAVYYSQEARMYSMASFLVALAIYLYIENRYLFLSLTIAAIGMTDYVSLFILPVFMFIGIKKKNIWLINIPLITVFIFWAQIFLRQLTAGAAIKSEALGWWQILGVVNFKNIALIPIKFAIGRIRFDNHAIYGLVVLVIFVVFTYVIAKTKKVPNLIWLWLLMPIFIGIIVGFVIPTLSYFRFLFCLPALYILLACGLDNLKGIKYKTFLFMLLAINSLTTGYYLSNPRFQREDWRGLTSMLENRAMVLPSASQKEAFIYYKKGSQVIDIDGFNGDINEIWLSRYVSTVFDPGDLAQKKITSLGYNKAREYDFNGIVVWEYKKP